MQMDRLRIRDGRKIAGLTQLQLSEKLKTSLMTVQHWEAGRRIPSRENLEQLADALGRPVGWFFGEAEESVVPDDSSERTLLQLFAKQQDLVITQAGQMERQRQDNHAILVEQQAMMERQRQDVSRLTELLAKQQELFVELVRGRTIHGDESDMQQMIARKKAHGKAIQDIESPSRIKQ